MRESEKKIERDRQTDRERMRIVRDECGEIEQKRSSLFMYVIVCLSEWMWVRKNKRDSGEMYKRINVRKKMLSHTFKPRVNSVDV